MTTSTARQVATALNRAAVQGTCAPSVHNTQPWILRLSDGRLDVLADLSRQLRVLDPMSRQLHISLGCLLMNARISLARDGVGVTVTRFPDPRHPDLVARIQVDESVAPDADGLAALDNLIVLRQTNRRRFTDDEVPVELLDDAIAAAAAENSSLLVVHEDAQRLAVTVLSQRADEIENLNPAYRAELRAWTTDDAARNDGVRDLCVPHVDGSSQDEIPMRDFDTRGVGYLPAGTHSSMTQCMLLLCTVGDGRHEWVRAGEALERVLLEITRHGYVASPLTQVTEVPSARAQLRSELGMSEYPHVLLRVGRAPLTPGSRRRRLVDVLFEESNGS